MLSKVSRSVAPLALVALLASCNSNTTLSDAAPKGPMEMTQQAAAPVNAVIVQTTCPQIFMRDATAYHREYVKGGQDDPAKLIYQASFGETTRSCSTDGVNMTISVMAQGRIIVGPAGKPGSFNLPVRVSVTETSQVTQQESQIYSQFVRYPVSVTPDAPSSQFLFQKTDVTIPAGSAQNAKIYLSFESGPEAKAKRK